MVIYVDDFKLIMLIALASIPLYYCCTKRAAGHHRLRLSQPRRLMTSRSHSER